jgi:Carboxypeptidase regulatory-like domain
MGRAMLCCYGKCFSLKSECNDASLLDMAVRRIAAIVFFFAPLSFAFAQQSPGRSLTFKITDISGAAVAGAVVQLKLSRGGDALVFLSDSAGIANCELTPGTYLVEISEPGFCPWRKSVQLLWGKGPVNCFEAGGLQLSWTVLRPLCNRAAIASEGRNSGLFLSAPVY